MNKTWNKLAKQKSALAVEQLLQDVECCLRAPSVLRALGERGEMLLDLTKDHMAACEAVDGIVSAGNGGLDSNTVPVFMMGANESVTIEDMSRMPLQRECALYLYSRADSGSAMGDARLERLIDTYQPEGSAYTFQLPLYANATTVIAQSVHALPEDMGLPTMLGKGRPGVALLARGSRSRMASILLHEVSHALDHVVQPIVYDERQLRSLSSELAAYATQSLAVAALKKEGCAQWRYIKRRPLADAVEAVRFRVNGPYTQPGAFDVNDEIVAALEQHGLQGIYTNE